ncbi:MAG: hypothetical protein RL329_2766 [Bacteroidota bacterium]
MKKISFSSHFLKAVYLLIINVFVKYNFFKMTILNQKSMFISRTFFTLSLLAMVQLAVAQMNPSVDALVDRLQTNGYAFELNQSTGDVSASNQIILQFREGTTQQWKDEFIRNFKIKLSHVLRTTVHLQVIKKCDCGNIENWELSAVSGALSCSGNKDRITTTSRETSSSMQGGDNLLKIDLNYYQSVQEGSTIRPNNAPLSNLIKGIRLNNGSDKKIEIIDTGIDPIHPNQGFRNALWNDPKEGTNSKVDLNGNCYKGDKLGYNFVDDNNLPLDYQSHGTHVAGIIYKNSSCIPTKLLIAKALDDNGVGSDFAIACAIHYGVRQGVDVINMSFGRTGTASTIVEKAVSTAVANNIVLVASSGNFLLDNDIIPMWPANFPNVISVNATSANDNHSLWESIESNMGSNYGAKRVHIAAEGEAVYSTVPGGYARKSGTSMAAPQVTAAVAVLKSRNSRWNAANIRNNIFRNAHLKEHYKAQGFNQHGILSDLQYCKQRFPEEESQSYARNKRNIQLADANVVVAPNPVTDISMVTIEYAGAEKIAHLTLTNIEGKVLLQNKISINGTLTQEPLDISLLPKGIYILKVVVGEVILSKRIVKF